MPFPTGLKPSSRTFEPGDYPIKRFTSQSGVETRILYGTRRTGQKMSLTYQNILDSEAEDFVNHYDEVFGTLNPFIIATANTTDGAKSGWNGISAGTIGAGSYSSGWRYEGPPQLTQVRPGISTVTVNLIAVL